jgi:hypothetical protein
VPTRVPYIGDLTKRFVALGCGPGARRAVGRVVRDLCDARELPGLADVLMALEREGRLPLLAHGRRMPEQRLWVWYLATESDSKLSGSRRASLVPRDHRETCESALSVARQAPSVRLLSPWHRGERGSRALGRVALPERRRDANLLRGPRAKSARTSSRATMVG